MSWKKTIQTIEPSKTSWKDTIKEVPEVSKLESGARGAAQGATMSFSDEITGAAGGIWDDMVSMLNGERQPAAKFDDMGRVSNLDEINKNATYTKHRDEARNANKSAQEANPLTYGVSEFGAAMATSFVPGMGALNAGKNATLATKVGLGATQGGIAGLGMSNADNFTDLATDTAIGGLVGGAVPVALHGAGKVLSSVNKDNFNKAVSKTGQFFTGVDEDAILRNINRPQQVSKAANNKFGYELAQNAMDEIQTKGQDLGSRVAKSEADYLKNNGSKFIPGIGQDTGEMIDDFLTRNAPSQKGFSALDKSQINELETLKKLFASGELTGDDLVKSREYLDHVEKLAGKYDKDGTGPFVNFLKNVRHNLNEKLRSESKDVAFANQDYSDYLNNKKVLGLNNESTAESVVNNLYGGMNKTAKQEAAERLLSPQSLDGFKDVATNKAFEAAKKPGGDNYFRRGALAVVTGGTSEIVTSPSVWKHGTNMLGRIQSVLGSDPGKLGKYAAPLQQAMQRGNTALASTIYILQQNDPQFRQLMSEKEE